MPEKEILSPKNASRTRPGMKEYGIHEDSDGMLSWSWVDAEMEKSRNYWVCSTRPDGNPHAAPVWGIWIDGTLYFGSGLSSRKARNIAHNAQVVVHLESGDDTVIMEGTAGKMTDRATLDRINRAYAAKYPPFDPTQEEPKDDDFLFMFTPVKVLAWFESDFPRTATRWLFES